MHLLERQLIWDKGSTTYLPSFFILTFLSLFHTFMQDGMSGVLKIVIFGVPLLVLLILGLLLRPCIVKKVRGILLLCYFASTYSSLSFTWICNLLAHSWVELLLHRDLVILEKEIVSESDSRFSLFRYSKIRSATDNFSKENKLGEGGFGHVYKVIAFTWINLCEC